MSSPEGPVPGTVVSPAVTPRSYIVDTESGEVRRNRCQLRVRPDPDQHNDRQETPRNVRSETTRTSPIKQDLELVSPWTCVVLRMSDPHLILFPVYINPVCMVIRVLVFHTRAGHDLPQVSLTLTSESLSQHSSLDAGSS